MFLAYFVLLKSFLILFYFINSLFKRKRVWKLTQESIKMSKYSYFSFSFKLNEKKKAPLKKYGLERGGGVTRKFLLEGGLIFNRELQIKNREILQKEGGLTRKGGRKRNYETIPQRNYVASPSMKTYYLNLKSY